MYIVKIFKSSLFKLFEFEKVGFKMLKNTNIQNENKLSSLNIKWQTLFEEINKSKQNICIIGKYGIANQ